MLLMCPSPVFYDFLMGNNGLYLQHFGGPTLTTPILWIFTIVAVKLSTGNILFLVPSATKLELLNHLLF